MAWAVLSGGLYGSFFGQLERIAETDVGGLPGATVVAIKGVLYAISLVSLVARSVTRSRRRRRMTPAVTLTVETSPATATSRARATASPSTRCRRRARPGFLPLAVFARDAEGALVGGISGTVNWNWLHVSLFWISAAERHGGPRLAPARRDRGRGDRARLRARAPRHVQLPGAPVLRAPRLPLFATLADYPPGHSRYFLRKDLRA